jgi:hypothetical protein
MLDLRRRPLRGHTLKPFRMFIVCGLMKFLILVLLMTVLFLLPVCAQSANVNHDPASAKFVTSDILNFWHAYDLASNEPDRARRLAIYQAEYLDKGSPGLKDFVGLRFRTADNLVRAIEHMPKFYASIRDTTMQIPNMEKRFRASFRKFRSIYPDAVFPDVYFVIGVSGTGGTTGRSGLLIGAEMFSLNGSTPLDEMNPWLRKVLSANDKLPAIVAHESCHYNQAYPNAVTLLDKSIQEGSCDFIGETISGGNINAALKEYGRTYDAEIWRDFSASMDKPGWLNWIYNGAFARDRPADLGYYMGYRICESYYRNSRDKRGAVRDILNIRDFRRFFKASGYRGPTPKSPEAD